MLRGGNTLTRITRGDDYQHAISAISKTMTFHRLLTLMLLLAGTVHAESTQSRRPSARMAQCEAPGLSSSPQPFDAILHPRTTTATAAVADVSPSNEPAPFVREWRAVMTSGEAKLLPYAGSAFKIERRRISAAQLDALEALLLPMLAAELKSMGSRNPPCSYFRQYAAARSGKHQVILVPGYLRDAGPSIECTRKPVDASDGAASCWDAADVVKRHRFAKLKRDGDAARHTLIFQGAARTGSRDTCVDATRGRVKAVIDKLA